MMNMVAQRTMLWCTLGAAMLLSAGCHRESLVGRHWTDAAMPDGGVLVADDGGEPVDAGARVESDASTPTGTDSGVACFGPYTWSGQSLDLAAQPGAIGCVCEHIEGASTPCVRTSDGTRLSMSCSGGRWTVDSTGACAQPYGSCSAGGDCAPGCPAPAAVLCPDPIDPIWAIDHTTGHPFVWWNTDSGCIRTLIRTGMSAALREQVTRALALWDASGCSPFCDAALVDDEQVDARAESLALYCNAPSCAIPLCERFIYFSDMTESPLGGLIDTSGLHTPEGEQIFSASYSYDLESFRRVVEFVAGTLGFENPGAVIRVDRDEPTVEALAALCDIYGPSRTFCR